MTRRPKALLAMAAIFVSASGASVYARGNDWNLTDGKGESVTIKNGFFGRKDAKIQDRLGDGVRTKRGLFGSKETDVSVLGNQFQQKKGWFGSSDVKGKDILGDTITTKKGLFGRRTTVNVAGASNLIEGLVGKHKNAPAPASIPRPDSKDTTAGELTPLGDPNNMNGQ